MSGTADVDRRVADALAGTLAALDAAADVGGPLDPLEWDGARWTRYPTSTVDVLGRPRQPAPVDAGWVAVARDGGVWVVIDALDVDPRTGETGRCLSCARSMSRELRPAVEHGWLADADLDHVSPPDRRAVAQVCGQAAGLVGDAMRRRAAAVTAETRWLLAVVERLTGVMERHGWKR